MKKRRQPFIQPRQPTREEAEEFFAERLADLGRRWQADPSPEVRALGGVLIEGLARAFAAMACGPSEAQRQAWERIRASMDRILRGGVCVGDELRAVVAEIDEHFPVLN
jgi:hypothetical protein